MNTKKRILLIIIAGVLGFILLSDVVKLCIGYSYTWFGFITMFISFILLGIIFDMLEI